VQVQLPDLVHKIPTEAVDGLAVDQPKSGLPVDATGGSKGAVCPKGDLPIPCSAGESHAFIYKPVTDAQAASYWLDEQQAKLGRIVRLLDEHH